jgi:hypothetical protein
MGAIAAGLIIGGANSADDAAKASNAAAMEDE